MLGLLDAIKVGGGVVLGVGIATGPVYLYGKSAGRNEAATAALQKSVDVLRERGKIDETISRSDIFAMCGLLGLPDDERAECLRRLAQDDAVTGNGG